MTRRSDYEVRLFEPEDEQAVLDLLTASLGPGPEGRRTSRFFTWKHLDNPFGRSLMLVATDRDGLLGWRAFMRWQFASPDGVIRAVRAVDTATHPRARGRGVFTELTMTALEMLRGSTEFVFNTPNRSSLPGYLKMGWRTAGSVPVWVRPLRIASFIRPRPASEEPQINADAVSLERALDLLGEQIARHSGRLQTNRTKDYLRWRYGPDSSLAYRTVMGPSPVSVDGTAIFRVRRRGRRWEVMVLELWGNARSATSLLRHVGRVSDADHLTVHFSEVCGGSARPLHRGLIRAPKGILLTTRPVPESEFATSLSTASFAFSLGDLELF